MKRIKTSFISAGLLLAVLLYSCGSASIGAPGKPTALDPDSENPNKIEINWKAVEGADIYYIYRSTTESGTYSLEGHSVTSGEITLENDTTELRYSFIDAFAEGDGGTYWYGVTAAANSDITLESAMSPVVSASTYSGTWGTAKILGSAARLKLTADTSALWAVYSLGTGNADIDVQKYAEDETSEEEEPDKIWSEISTPMVTDGNVNGPYSVFISGGELHTVFADTSATPADAVSMQNYHNWGTAEAPSYAWEQVGSAGFNGAAATEISAVTVGFSADIYSAFLEGTDADEGSLWNYNSTTQAWVESDMSSTIPVDVSAVKIVSHNNSLYFGYEDLVDTGLYLREFDSILSTLEPEDGTEVSDSAIDDGNVVFVSGGGSLYAVYITSAGSFEVEQLVDDIWTPISNTAGMPVIASGNGYGTLDALWFNGYLYVFYLNSGDSDNGWVKYYDEDEGWQSAEKNGEEITGGGDVTTVQLVTAGSVLYAGYIEDDIAYVRILE